MSKIIVVIDMNNGFAKQGNLYSPNVERLILPIQEFLYQNRNDSEIIYYSDAHRIDDIEFNEFPIHCLKGSLESEYVSELKGLENYYIEKDTTDGFMAKNPLEIVENKGANIYVCGCVTEICVYNFVKSMLKHLKNNNLNNELYVLENLVNTFDGVNNDAKERHQKALTKMAKMGAHIINSKDVNLNNKMR